MYYFELIAEILLFVVFTYFFVMVIYNKIKVHNVRMKMQEEGQINQDVNISMQTFWNIFFWILPLTKYIKEDNEDHNQRVKKVNYSLLGVLISVIVFEILTMILEK